MTEKVTGHLPSGTRVTCDPELAKKLGVVVGDEPSREPKKSPQKKPARKRD